MRRIYLWTLGHLSDNPNASVIPSREHIERFKAILKTALEDGEPDNDVHLVWPVGVKVEVHEAAIGGSDVHIVSSADEIKKVVEELTNA